MQFFVGAVAEGFGVGGFAGAPGDGFFFFDFNKHGPHAGGAVGAVAKGLLLRLAARTPDIAPGFDRHDTRCVIRHSFYFKGF